MTPEATPGYSHVVSNYSLQGAAGYTHLFGASTILNLRYAWTETNDAFADQAAGTAFESSLNFLTANPPQAGVALGPGISMTSYTGVSQFAVPLGPQRSSEIHVDMSKVDGNHTITVGGMYYHIYSYDGGFQYPLSFTQNTTSQDDAATGTGNGAASFVLGVGCMAAF